jgi:hypothetical protein
MSRILYFLLIFLVLKKKDFKWVKLLNIQKGTFTKGPKGGKKLNNFNWYQYVPTF